MRRWLFLCAVCLVLSGPASGGPTEDTVVRQLKDQGFSQIQVTSTWLGRSRIVSRRGGTVREIILNPLTGEILRDYWSTQRGGEGQTLFDPPNGGDGAGKYDDDDDDDDDDDYDDRDDDDDDRDDDNSGRGGGDDGDDD